MACGTGHRAMPVRCYHSEASTHINVGTKIYQPRTPRRVFPRIIRLTPALALCIHAVVTSTTFGTDGHGDATD